MWLVSCYPIAPDWPAQEQRNYKEILHFNNWINSRASAMAGLPCKCQFGLNFTVGTVTGSIDLPWGWNKHSLVPWGNHSHETSIPKRQFTRWGSELKQQGLPPINPLTLNWPALPASLTPQSKSSLHYLRWLAHENTPQHVTSPSKKSALQSFCTPWQHEICHNKLHNTRPITGGQTHEVISPLRYISLYLSVEIR